jgi:hypothetical protein
MSEPKCHKDVLQEPPNILVRVPGKKPGQRIGVVKFYEAGYYSTNADHTEWNDEQVDEFVSYQNRVNGIPDEVADSAFSASMFGWHVPAATPAIEWFKQFRLENQ